MTELLAEADELADRIERDDYPVGEWYDGAPLRAMIAGREQRAAAEKAIARAVCDARAAGMPWGLIGVGLNTSGEAARQKYGEYVQAELHEMPSEPGPALSG